MSGIKVLVIEDSEMLQSFFARAMEEKVTVLQARTVAEAERLFAANPNIRAIALDGCLVPGGDELTTLPLARKFRKNFVGPMIAMSSKPSYRRRLIEAGCDHEISDKLTLPRKFFEIFGI